MRGGKLSGDSSYSTLIASSSDNSEYLATQGSPSQQNVDRNTSAVSGEGAPINMSAPAFKGLIPPGAYYGGKRRRGRKMRGGMGSLSDGSEAENADASVNAMELSTGEDLAQMVGGRRRRRRGRKMRGGNQDLMPMTAENPSGPLPDMDGGKRRMRGGMYDNNINSELTPIDGGSRKRRSKRGGGIISTAALPFGLFGLQKYFQGRKSGSMENRTRRHRRSRR
jgi:hypothetical protein